MNTPKPFHDATQAVVFLEVLAGIVAKSPVAINEGFAMDFAGHLLQLAESVIVEAQVNGHALEVTRAYASLDWHGEILANLISPEHRDGLNK